MFALSKNICKGLPRLHLRQTVGDLLMAVCPSPCRVAAGDVLVE
jgi:hypothetical protein